MIFVIDSGSTKCDWIAIDSSTGEPIFDKQRTRGLNPAIISSTDAFDIIKENEVIYGNKLSVSQIYFYGAGCGTEKPVKMLKGVLQSIFENAKVVVKEDTYAAVYATVGVSHSPAVVCILGTGSNCSYYNGESVEQRIISLGYSVMDDASGNYYGRQLLRDYYFDHMPHDLKLVFKTRYDVNDDVIKSNLYKKANPNAYLATFAVTTMVDFGTKVLGTQNATLQHLYDFKKQISDSRTFSFLHELEMLLENGLIKGCLLYTSDAADE